MSTFIRRYAKYINEKAISYRSVAFDFCKVKRGYVPDREVVSFKIILYSSQNMHLLMMIYQLTVLLMVIEGNFQGNSEITVFSLLSD